MNCGGQEEEEEEESDFRGEGVRWVNWAAISILRLRIVELVMEFIINLEKPKGSLTLSEGDFKIRTEDAWNETGGKGMVRD